MENTVIEFRNVAKSYQGRPVFSGIHFTVNGGEFVTMIGSSGCGKTTILKMVNRLLEPDGGEIAVFGRLISHEDPIALRRRIGYVIQNIGLFPHMTVERNIGYVLNLEKHRDKGLVAARVREMMRLVRLDETLLGRYPGELSGGQKQRVGIARALAADPEILLMDEPFSAVDEITRKALQGEIRRIQRECKITVLFVTHDMQEAFTLGDRIIVMGSGGIEQIGTGEEIRRQPATEFVRQLTAIK